MLWILGVIAIIILIIIIWFKLSYSPTKREFEKLIRQQIAKTQFQNDHFSAKDLSKLPSPVQRYFHYCGFIDTPKMTNMRIDFNNVDFVLSPDKPMQKIKYTQYNFVEKPTRFAYIGTSLFGIPFEGIDSYQNGTGSMKGVIAKAFTLFNQKGEAMDKACLVTCLSESLMIPLFALQDFITWEELDESHAKATISYYGLTASGIFTFDTDGAMTAFTTEDRAFSDGKGEMKKVKWTAFCSDYKEVNGIKYPNNLKAVWHFETGDLLYFHGRDINIEYNVFYKS